LPHVEDTRWAPALACRPLMQLRECADDGGGCRALLRENKVLDGKVRGWWPWGAYDLGGWWGGGWGGGWVGGWVVCGDGSQ
jgi:hypothetical protein